MSATQETQETPVVRCRRCGRRLKREPGITNGIGPRCMWKEREEFVNLARKRYGEETQGEAGG